ncbi:ferric reduction oxidase 6-like isoform X3 [Malus sylvestris]|uniref:ferric reduction oxidase 6-like isoform X3 n=1 Tax=Malus sylvestris TaxID=3752 RepID=UPI0021AC17BF|nr:ferric reduction oxidase 6-like isoform X3 [Malus sylvestris]
MDDEIGVHNPLLSSHPSRRAFVRKIPLFVTLAKWILKITMWVLFISWVVFIFLFPLGSVQTFFGDWIAATDGTLFGTTGTLLLLFNGPLLVIALLSIAFLAMSGEEELPHKKKKTSQNPSFRLWTFPILVDGPFGVVSAAELIGILLFVVYTIWSVSYYAVSILGTIPGSLSLKAQSCLFLAIFGAYLASSGMFCLAFLFLPIARGSVLLRLIDIPFEHATRYHVWLGHLTMSLFTLHGLCYIVTWAMEGNLLAKILEWREIGVANLAGVISLAAGLLMWVTSLPPVRKLNFELFFYTHQLYVIFIAFLAMHVGDFLFVCAAGGIFIYILDRFLRFCQSRRTVGVISAKCLPCGTVELVLAKPENLQYNALSFIFLQVRELSWLQWHPFSVSSSPLDGRLCQVRNILIVWAVKTSNELPLLSTIDMDSVSSKLNIQTLIYVTRESGPPLEEGQVLNSALEFPPRCPPRPKRCSMSVLVGSGDNLWSGLYLISSTVGLVIILGLLDVLYINPYRISAWWYKGLLLLLCMVASVVVFGGLVVGLWHLWERKFSPQDQCEDDTSDVYKAEHEETVGRSDSNEHRENLSKLTGIRYGARPNFKGMPPSLKCRIDKRVPICTFSDYLLLNAEIFGTISKDWGTVDAGVIVCGPPSFEASVAKEIRSHNLRRQRDDPIFHFNSHSFDL